MNESMAKQAAKLMQKIPGYHWLGERPHWQVRRKLAQAQLLVISSRMEGGANVVSEALAAGVPVLASDIAGNIGMLGKNYAGYYRCGDEHAQAALLQRTETDAAFYQQLQEQCAARACLVQPEHESSSLQLVIEKATKQKPTLLL